tara:strand:- start:602 stop:817 length:216 start_codon:yes stop_codon:yes gene_type:complete
METKTNTGLDELIIEAKKSAKNPKFLILSPLGTMILGEVLGEDNPMGLPKTYMGLEIVYTIDQYAEIARVH